MSGQTFTFPPPPPAPPQTSLNFPTYSQPQHGYSTYGGRSNRGSRGHWDRGRGNGRGGSRGGAFGSQISGSGTGGNPRGIHEQHGFQNKGFGTQAIGQGHDRFSQPKYPAVQLPQYPANLRQDYGHRPSNFLLNNGSQQIQVPFTSYGQPAQHYQTGQSSYSSNDYGSPMNGMQFTTQGSYGVGHVTHNFNSPVNPPASMNQAILPNLQRDQHSHQSQSLPQPTASGTIATANAPNSGADLAHQQSSFTNFQSSFQRSSDSHSSYRGRNQKRRPGEAFGKSRNPNPRPRAPPAVPSFGGALPLPVKPPIPQEQGGKPRKKKRKHNQLGLTPKTEDHESSEEDEDDVDEESKLAKVAFSSGGESQLLQFEYRGQTSTLKSSSEIAAWIEERRKRFPTKARAVEAAERKRQRDEAQKVATKARKEAQEMQRAGVKQKQRLKSEAEQKRHRSKENAEDIALKAKKKVEKLRKQLEKEEKRVAKAEAKATKCESKAGAAKAGETYNIGDRGGKQSASEVSALAGPGPSERQDTISSSGAEVRTEAHSKISEGNVLARGSDETCSEDAQQKSQEIMPAVPNPLTPTSQPRAPDEDIDIKVFSVEHKRDSNDAQEKAIESVNIPSEAANIKIDQAIEGSNVSMSDSSSEIASTDSEDLTSSSGSSSSASDTEDDPPQQASSKRNGPERIAPPKRMNFKQICREFLKSGRCKRGDSCRFKHELPERGSHTAGLKRGKETQGRTERVSLYQRLVNQEKEKEDHDAQKAIIHPGEEGHLNLEKGQAGN